MILQALDRYYDRMAARGEAEPPGWAREPVALVAEISIDGRLIALTAHMDASGKRPKIESMPKWFGRSGNGSTPFFLWDNTAYALGISQKDPAKTKRDHTSFKELHIDRLSSESDPGLNALRLFLEKWDSGALQSELINTKLVDRALAFRLEGDKTDSGSPRFIHQRPAARAAIQRLLATVAAGEEGFCLVSGRKASIARLHPKLKNLPGTSAAETPLVSFNEPSFCSYGQDQGANAPTSEAATQRYGAALNALLASGTRNRLKRGIGDATVVFWADASNAQEEKAADAVEAMFAAFLTPPEDAPKEDGDAGQTVRMSDALVALAEGRPQRVDPALKPGVRFHVLGLSPNAARLSVRFWLSDSFEAFAKALLRHMEDIKIEPPPRGWTGKKGPPEIWRLLVKTTALQEKFENVPPLLAGELARAVLGGGPYPRTWLNAAIIRLRAGDDASAGWHAAAIKACLNRNRTDDNEELPVGLKEDHTSKAYQLGRLFAVIEAAQYAALGRVNATVADRYYGAASSTPARVFASLLRNARNHVSDAKRRGGGGWIERKLDEIIGRLPPDFPTTLGLEDQGRFAVGYYHERASRPAKVAEPDAASDADAEPAAAHS